MWGLWIHSLLCEEQSLRIPHSVPLTQVSDLPPFCNYKMSWSPCVHVTPLWGHRKCLQDDRLFSRGCSGRAAPAPPRMRWWLGVRSVRGAWDSHVKAGLGCERSKFLCWGKTDNTGMCFIKFRKIYNLKGMKKKKKSTFEGTRVWYMRKPHLWKTAFLS